MRDGAERHFTVPLRRAMRREGLAGSKAEVRLEGEALLLIGDSGGTIRISAREVDRLRIASLQLPPPRHSTKPPRTVYETWIRRRGSRAAVRIGPPGPGHGGPYRATIREFAGWVFADGGAVYRGPGLATLIVEMAWVVVPLSLIGLLLLGGAIVEGRFWLWLVAFFVLASPIVLARRAWRRHWPRRVSRPEELDEVLPPPEGSWA